MWTKELYDVNILGLEVFLVRQDGLPKHYAIFPADGFLVRVPTLDAETEDEQGMAQVIRYVSRGGCAEQLSYDWSVNPKGYAAVKETEVSGC